MELKSSNSFGAPGTSSANQWRPNRRKVTLSMIFGKRIHFGDGTNGAWTAADTKHTHINERNNTASLPWVNHHHTNEL